MRPFWRVVFVSVAVVVILVIAGGLLWMCYRQNVNEGRCEAALGSGAVWAGGDKCFSPPERVEGLLR